MNDAEDHTSPHTSHDAIETTHEYPPSRDDVMRLLPVELACILQDRPLYAFEQTEGYDDLLQQMTSTYGPRDAVEVFLIKDMCDAVWDTRRLRRMRNAALDAALADLLHDMTTHAHVNIDMHMRKAGSSPQEQHAASSGAHDARTEVMHMVRKAGLGDGDTRERLLQILQDAGTTLDVVQDKAFHKALDVLSMLEDLMSKAEKRRDDSMHKIEDRRRVGASMSRSLLQPRKRPVSLDVTITPGGAK